MSLRKAILHCEVSLSCAAKSQKVNLAQNDHPVRRNAVWKNIVKVSHCELTPKLRRETSMSHRGILMSNSGQQRLNVNRTSEAKVEFWRGGNVIVVYCHQ